MVRKREDGRWEGRIVVGHKEHGNPTPWHLQSLTFLAANRTHTEREAGLARLPSPKVNKDGNVTGYTYDAAGNCLSIAYPDGRAMTTAYDTLGNP